MSYTVAFIFSIIVASQAANIGSGESLGRSDKDEMVEVVKRLLTFGADSIQAQVNERVQELNETIWDEANNGAEHIKAFYQLSLSNVRAAASSNKACLEGAENQLRSGLQGNLEGFWQCANISRAMDDLVDIAQEAIKLEKDILLMVGDLMAGMSQLWIYNPRHHPIKFVKELIKWMVIYKEDIKTTARELVLFFNKCKTEGNDLKAQIRFCKEHSNSLLLQQSSAAFSHLNSCQRPVF